MKRLIAIASMLHFFTATTARAVEPHEMPAQVPAPPPAQPQPLPNPAFTTDCSQQPLPLTVGQAGSVIWHIRVVAPWDLRSQTPFKAELEAPAAVSITAPLLADQSTAAKGDGSYSFTWSVVANTPGEHPLLVHNNYFLCSKTVCQRFEGKVACAVQAQGMPSAPNPTPTPTPK